MSIKSMTWAFSQPLSGNEKVVLLALADFADDDGACWPSIPRLAEKAYLSTRTVQRIILQLTDQGYLKFERRAAENGRSLSSMYRLIFEGDSLSPKGDTDVTGEGDTVVTTYEPSIRTVSKQDNTGARVPENFVPDESCMNVARDCCIHGIAFQTQLDAFMDYWRAVPGAKGRKLDWQGTFRNWLCNSRPFNHGKSHGTRQKPNSIAHSFAVVDAAIEAERQRIEQGWRELEASGNGQAYGDEGIKLIS